MNYWYLVLLAAVLLLLAKALMSGPPDRPV